METKFTKRTSQFKGVSWKKSNQQWRVQLNSIHLGFFDDEIEASNTYIYATRILKSVNLLHKDVVNGQYLRKLLRKELNEISESNTIREKLLKKTERKKNKTIPFTENLSVKKEKIWQRKHWMKLFNEHYVGGEILSLPADVLKMERQMVDHPKFESFHLVERDGYVYDKMVQKFMNEFPKQKEIHFYNKEIKQVMSKAFTHGITCYVLDYCGFYITNRNDILKMMRNIFTPIGTLIFLTFQNSRVSDGNRSEMEPLNLNIKGLPQDTIKDYANKIPQNIFIMNDILVNANMYNDSDKKFETNKVWECLSNTYYKRNMMQMVFKRTK